MIFSLSRLRRHCVLFSMSEDEAVEMFIENYVNTSSDFDVDEF